MFKVHMCGYAWECFAIVRLEMILSMHPQGYYGPGTDKPNTRRVGKAGCQDLKCRACPRLIGSGRKRVQGAFHSGEERARFIECWHLQDGPS